MTKEFGSNKKPLKVKDGIDWSTVGPWIKPLEIANKTPKIYTSTPEGPVLTNRGKNNEKH